MLRINVHWLDYVKSQPCLAMLDWPYSPTRK